MSELYNISRDSHNFIVDCHTEIEASKLSIWRLKSELSSTKNQLSTISRELEQDEFRLRTSILEAKRCKRNLIKSSDHVVALRDLKSNWAFGKSRNLKKVVCGLFTKSSISDSDLAQIIEDIENWSAEFNPKLVNLDGMAKYAKELERQLNEGKLAGLMSAFAAWCFQAYSLTLLEQSLPTLVEKTVKGAKTKTELYTLKIELEESINELDERLRILCNCIDEATRTPSSVQSIGPTLGSKTSIAASFAFRQDKSQSILLSDSQQEMPPSYMEVFEESVNKEVCQVIKEQTYQSPTVTEERLSEKKPTPVRLVLKRKKKSVCCCLFG
mmetsp:Transcript_6138/g.10749  ORF Transcript_6138/g.10749 Transcript_6138/m.10749 type:complete len:327 (-) Transcript_6138:44-1024(-)